jgi:hypothetical protein
LWRAAASKMAEFAEIDVRASNLRRLRRMLLTVEADPFHFFPMTLTQLSSKGPIHNLTPLSQRKPKFPWSKNSLSIPIYRFYFDGLIAHFHRQSNLREIDELGDMFVGHSNELLVPVVPFEGSWQKQNADDLIREAEDRWPDRLARIPGFSEGKSRP